MTLSPILDGLGADWPMAYEDMAPYYDKTEALIGIYGSNEGLGKYAKLKPGRTAQSTGPTRR